MSAYLSLADFLYYGGAAGGGKTDLLIGMAVTAHKKSIIFRREYSQLTEIIDRSRDMLAETAARYNGQKYLWYNIPGGRTLELGAMKLEEYREKFKGRPHDFKGFDEVPDFSESGFRFLTAWTRTTIPDQRVRVVCAGNPPLTPEGDWVIRFWAPWLDDQYPNKAEPEELRWFARLDDKDIEVESSDPFEFKGELIEPKSRTFIPARLSDNPYLERAGYRATLQALPEPLRSKLLAGDFTTDILSENPWQLILPINIKASWKLWEDGPSSKLTDLGVDPARGGKDETVIAKKYGNWIAPLEVYPGKATPTGSEVADLVIAALDGATDVSIKVDVVGIGASTVDVLKERGIKGVIPVHNAEKSYATDSTGELGFINVRAESYWTVRERLSPNATDPIRLPSDNILLADLAAVNWAMQARGIQVESKDQIRKKIGRSPGRGDAVVLACFEGVKGVFFW